MAGRGGNESAAAEGEPKNLPSDIESAGEKLVDWLTNPKVAFIRGFEGVGRWSIAEHAIQKSKHLFDVHIQVKLLVEDFSLQKAQKEIASKLGMTTSTDVDGVDEDGIDTQAATEICTYLMGRKFLLVIGDVPKDIDFKLIGDPHLRRVLQNGSEIVLVGPNDLKSNVAIKLEDLSMDMLRAEASDIANCPLIKGSFTPDTVLDCFFYLLLFPDFSIGVRWLRWRWRAEGFIITEEGEEEDLMMFDKLDALLRELHVRSMVVYDNVNVEMPKSVAEKAKSLVISRQRRASTHGRFWIEDGSLPMEDDEVEDIQRMVVLKIPKLSPLPQKCSKLSTLFLSGGDRMIEIPETFFEQIQGLRVLHLDGIVNESMPKSASCLHNLRFLRLTSCPHLQTLLSSFQIFYKLESLELSGELYSIPSIPDEIFQHMKNLRYLLLDEMQVTSLHSSISVLHNLRQLCLTNFRYLERIPDEFFEDLRQLRTLYLRGNSMMESLPSSISELVNLKELILEDCSSLKMNLLPHLRKLSKLQTLWVSSSQSDYFQDYSLAAGGVLPKLKHVWISTENTIPSISVKGDLITDSLDLYMMKGLEVVDISSTNLETLPENMSTVRHLKRLDMLDMKKIRKINWDDITTELEELNFSQCGNWESLNVNEQPGERGGARIRVSNSKLLQSFSPSSKLWDSKCFSRFHIYIAPCQEDEQERGKSIHLQRKQFTYDNIHSKIRTSDLPDSGSHFDKCLEIRGGRTSPSGIHGVLSRVELLTLRDNAAIQRLSEMGDVHKMKELKECRIKRCEQMEIFFEGDNASSDCLTRLEKIWMSNLARLRSLCEGTYASRSFALLKHIHLDYCLRLVTVFSSSVFLQSLETLEIKNCCKLKAVFEGDAAAEGSLQRLQTVFLWELPRLESICHGTYLSALKKLQVRGCGMLKKLPLRASDMAAASTSTGGGRVEVEGESEWWDHLKWEDKRIQHIINFKDPRPFTERR
ncbi:probable disease resistance protein At5g45510 [Magnolia sinica]|uniref:probable disease resistance protein At5g45510 n=1 Tax=Magnolia sinica TaxID=86752 RepID=UPI002657CD58|nr:probable disease resistance protein At5g45510 [Magnolia sinica]